MTKTRLWFLFGGPLVLAACACAGGDAPGKAAASAGVCDPEKAIGLFAVQLDEETTFVAGSVTERPVPGKGRDLVGEDGSCRLLRRNNAFCDPPCESGLLCVQQTGAQGSCVAEPRKVDVGTVSVFGLKKAVRMQPKGENDYFDTDLPAMAYDVGASIRLEASGKDLPAFSLQSVGVPLMEVTTTDWSLSPDKALALAWPAGKVPARVLVDINVDQHGNSPVLLHCELDDNGAATLKPALIQKLLDFGVSGFPRVSLTRRAASSTDLKSGCVGLEVVSVFSEALKISGHTPCKRQSDCPTGKTCDVKMETCR